MSSLVSLLKSGLVSLLILLIVPGQILAIAGTDYTAAVFDWVYWSKNQCTNQASAPTDGGPLYGLNYPSIGNDQDLVDAINKYIHTVHPDSPYNNMGQDFVDGGKQHNVNPLLALAQAQIESQLGTVPAASHNAFGIRGSGSGFRSFSSWQEGLNYYYQLLENDYVGPPNNFTTLQQLIHKYAPNGHGANCESCYVNNIKNIEKQVINNLPAGTVTASGSSVTPPSSNSGNTSLLDRLIPKAYAAAASNPLGPDLDGHKLPTDHGGLSAEDPINPDGSITTGGGKVTFANNAGLGQEYRDYYINMRWRYVTWNWDGTAGPPVDPQENSSWYGRDGHPPLVLVTDPKTGKSIIADILESGPAPWTGTASGSGSPPSYWQGAQDGNPPEYKGRSVGLPPTAVQYLGAHQRMADGSGEDLLVAWAPDQNARPGPTNLMVGDVSAGANCQGAIPITNTSFIQHDFFHEADGLMGHPPTMIGLHFTAGNEQTPDDLIRSLDHSGSTHDCNTQSRPGYCSVQLTIDPKGNVYQLTSRLDVKTESIPNFNDSTIAIEIMGANEQTLLNNDAQYKAVVNTVVQLMKQYNIKMQTDYLNKAGLMGHMECDDWTESHIGTQFQGIYSGETVHTDGGRHDDPGPTYMRKVRDALQQQGAGQ